MSKNPVTKPVKKTVTLGAIPEEFIKIRGADAVAIRYGDDLLTGGELEERSRRRAWFLKEQGVNEGDWVTVALPNGTDFFEVIFALWKLGATPHVVSPRLPHRELSALVELAQPKKIIASSDKIVEDFSALPANFGRDHPCIDPVPEAISKPWKAMSSGGSTGRPKIIAQPSAATFDNSMLQLPGMGAILTTGPLYHNMPVLTSVWSIYCGSQVVGMDRFDPEEALQLIERHKVSWAGFVPTMMNRIWQLPDDIRRRYDVSCLNIVYHYAAPMPPALKQHWIDWLGPKKIWELYGATEGIGTTCLNGEAWLKHRGSVGRPVRDSLKIVDESGQSLPAGEVGEVFAKTPDGMMPSYYYVGSEARKDAEGYESVGDFGWLDDEGYLYIADRRTDMIVCGGTNIFPAEIEGAMMAHPFVEEAVVIGLPHEDLGAAVHAIVKPSSEGEEQLDDEELVTFLKDRLIRYKIPRTFEFTSQRLRDDAGKVRRKKLREDRIAAAKPDAD